MLKMLVNLFHFRLAIHAQSHDYTFLMYGVPRLRSYFIATEENRFVDNVIIIINY